MAATDLPVGPALGHPVGAGADGRLWDPFMPEPQPLLAGRQRGAVQPPDHVPPDDRAVLEPVAGAAADQPDVVELGMTVDHEVTVGRGLVLADPRLDDRRGCEIREPAHEIAPGEPDRFRVDDPLA